PNFDFMGIRYYWFTATILLTIFGVTVFAIRVKDKKGLNIDFVGGTAYTGLLKERKDIRYLRDRLGEDRQKEGLQIQSVRALDAPSGDPNEAANSFEITYADGTSRRVLLANRLTPEEVKQQASELPDHSVEQIFVSDPDLTQGSESKLFTVRTSEKA